MKRTIFHLVVLAALVAGTAGVASAQSASGQGAAKGVSGKGAPEKNSAAKGAAHGASADPACMQNSAARGVSAQTASAASASATGAAFPRTKDFFSKKGRRLFTIAYYGEKELPRDIRAIVKPEYYDYTILTVEEVRLDGRSIYFIDMEDDTTLKTVRIADGEMELVRTLHRGDLDARPQDKAIVAGN
ncbi:MAG TPA: hypothetical protein VKQ52_10325 [Puia sp.]|nr:hypothetical protein [Puia sp.]